LALNRKARYWYFSINVMGTGANEASHSDIEGKVQRVLQAEGMHTTLWERININKQIDGDGATALFKTAIVVHGLVRWGAPVKGRALQKDAFGLSPPATAISIAPEALVKELTAASLNPGHACNAVENVRVFLVGQRGTLLGQHLADDLGATFLGMKAKYGPKGVADSKRWGASLDGEEAVENDEYGAEGEGDDGGKKVEERLLDIKEMIDTGSCEMVDIRERYYVDYLRNTASFRADIAFKKEGAIQMPGVEYGMLNTWQKGCVHLTTQTEADDRTIHWYVDEVGGKVILMCPPVPPMLQIASYVTVFTRHSSPFSSK
jgi:hypothetical protein